MANVDGAGSTERHEANQSDRILLRPETTDEDVEVFADSSGWSLVERVDGDVDAGIDPQIIWEIQDIASLHYIEEAMSHMRYLVIAGEQRRTVDGLAAVVTASLNPWTLEELYVTFDGAADEHQRAQASLRLGLAAPKSFERGVFERIAQALTDKDERVRYAAVWATTYTGYPEFVAVLTKMLKQEPTEWVRETVSNVIAAYTRKDGES